MELVDMNEALAMGARHRWIDLRDHGTRAASGQREGVYPAARSTKRGAPRATVGEGAEGLCLRRAERPRDPFAAVPRPQPIADLSLHVWDGLERGVQELLVLGR